MQKRCLMVLLTLSAALTGCATSLVDLPGYAVERKNQWANQGWSNDDRHWFHHESQGTSTFGLPFEWLVALQRPELSLSQVGLLTDQLYLARFGFIPSPASLGDAAAAASYGYTAPSQRSRWSNPQYPVNAGALPVGFAIGGPWYDPMADRDLPIPGTGRKARSVGLTCAACHTGQLEFAGQRILIDGGAGMISLDKFREALGKAFALTRYLPWRFDSFARRVLGDAYNSENKDRLREQVVALFEKGKAQAGFEQAQAAKPNAVEEGYTRLDALNRIGNEVFQAQMAQDENLHPISGPVSFPYIWNAPWFDWVQYNSSIQQPMVRNLGEAMGVKGKVDLTHPQRLFESNIPVKVLVAMEQLLAGEQHPLDARGFGGLRSPKWSELPLPPLKPELVARGRQLYMEVCVGCHLPPLASDEIFAAKYWRQVDPGAPQKYLALVTKPVLDIGTDCRAAYDMVYRTVVTADFIGNSGTRIAPAEAPKECPPVPAMAAKDGFTVTNFGVALGEVVYKTKERWYAANQVAGADRPEWNGHRPDPPASIRAMVSSRYPKHDSPEQALPVYKARPLNGVWATAPFLHNGSIPNLYLLLSPQAERDAEARSFYLGSREFDPVYVGYQYRDSIGTLSRVPLLASTRGLFLLDTTIVGNRNTGHLFTDDASAPGRIYREFSPDERFAIIEFIKSL